MTPLPPPPLRRLRWQRQYRIISAVYPPINFFEELVTPKQMEAAWYIESLTNDRLRDQTGDIHLVKPKDRVSGAGASPVMAAFTHIGQPSRFTDGRYGVYYAAKDLETAVRETAYHRTRFLAATAEPAGEITMRVYSGTVAKALHDIRSDDYATLHDPDDYQPSQGFAQALRATDAWGLIYRSVRHRGGQCIAALRPPAVSLPTASKLLAYVWTGERISEVYEKSGPLFVL